MASQEILIGVLFGAELVVILVGFGIYMLIRRRKNAVTEELAESEAESVDAETGSEAGDHAPEAPQDAEATSWLAEQISQSEAMLKALDEKSVPENASEAEAEAIPDTDWKQSLMARLKVLRLEAAAEASVSDPSIWRKTLHEGYCISAAGSPLAEDRTSEELDNLRSVIDNQHSLMRDLREQIEGIVVDPVQREVVSTRMDAADEQTQALMRCVNVIKEAQAILSTEDPSAEGGGSVEIAGIRTLIGDQQETIAKLNQMLIELASGPEQSDSLSAMLDSIGKVGAELETCVVTLESDNSRLREEIETLQGVDEQVAAAEIDSAEIEALRDKVQYLEQKLAESEAEQAGSGTISAPTPSDDNIEPDDSLEQAS